MPELPRPNSDALLKNHTEKGILAQRKAENFSLAMPPASAKPTPCWKPHIGLKPVLT